MVRYSDLTDRAYTVHSLFQDLSRQIKNAAVLTPDLIKAGNSSKVENLFFTNSQSIDQQLSLLNNSVVDTVNSQIARLLDKRVRSDLKWIINSNVPDSIIKKKSTAYISSFVTIDSLLNQGIERSVFLIGDRKKKLHETISRLQLWIILFVVLSSILLIYTIINLFNQQSRRKRKEEELKIVLNRISKGVVSVNNSWHYTFLNEAARTTFALRDNEPIGKIIWEVHPEMKGTVFWDKYHEAMLTKKVTAFESYYVPMDIWFSVRVYPSDDGLTIFYKNITEAKKSEESLLKVLKEVSDYKFALDESSIVAITDQKGIISYVNENFCKISGYTAGELIGMDHRIISSGYHSKSFIKELWTVIANGKIWKGELKNKAKDGTIYWVDTTIIPFLNSNGKPERYIAIRSDITLRKITERKLLQSEHIYRTVASSIPNSTIAIIDKEKRFLFLEGAVFQQWEYNKNKMIGQKAAIVLEKERYEILSPLYDRVLNGEHFATEIKLRGMDMYVQFVPLKDQNDSVESAMVIAMDITAIKRTQNELEKLNHTLENKVGERTAELENVNKELEAFTYSVSHDLRAPLRIIDGFSEILLEDYSQVLDDKGKRFLGIICINTVKMGQLIDELLKLSGLSRKLVFPVKVDMNYLVKEVLRDLDTHNSSAQIKLNDLLSATCDRVLMENVWSNLLSNAFKYSAKQEAPVIEIGSYVRNNEVVYFVKDNGVGFNMKYAGKLFGVFQRLHKPSDFNGIGIGLALVKRIVSKNGGTVWVESSENSGATFYFTLPL